MIYLLDLHDERSILTAYTMLAGKGAREIARDSSLLEQARELLRLHKKFTGEGKYPPSDLTLDYVQFTRALAMAGRAVSIDESAKPAVAV